MTPPTTVLAWEGILAPLDWPTLDGRTLAEPATGLQTLPLPLPLIFQPDGQAPAVCGTIEHADIRDAELHGERVRVLWGRGRFDTAAPCYAQVAERFAQRVGAHSVNVDLDSLEFGDSDPHEPLIIGTWRLIAATLNDHPAFPEARIWVREDGPPARVDVAPGVEDAEDAAVYLRPPGDEAA